jgi:hypothetical protein
MVRHGINIFTNEFNRMRQLLYFISLFISVGINAQVYIEADVTTGCIPLLVKFNIQPETARESIISYDWNFGDGTPNSIEDSCIHEFTQTGTFKVNCIISTANESYEIDSIKRIIHDFPLYGIDSITSIIPLVIKVMDCDTLPNIPNVFFPLSNFIEYKYFKIDTDGSKEGKYHFSVFTRSGTLIFKSDSPTIIWDGRSMSGQEMSTGIYYYTIHRNDNVHLNEVKGFVYLFR